MQQTATRQLGLPLALLAAGLGGAALYFTFDPARYPFPRCFFLLVSGLYCPGCGSQRALHALLHGDIGRAANFNLLAVLCVPLLLLGAADGTRAWLLQRPQRAALLYHPWVGWLVAGLTVVFAVVRNLPGPVGTWLAP